MNRCHTFEETKAAYAQVQGKGIFLGAHMIIGLPGESKDEILGHATEISKLPVHSLKLHHLQIVKHTRMAADFRKNPESFHLFDLDEYLDLITEFLAYLRPDIIVERFISQAPASLRIAPNWGGLKNFEIVAQIDKRLLEKELWQGKYYEG